MSPNPPEMPMNFDVDFNEAPLLVIWEVTRACALACQHCRASAIDVRDPRELSTEEGCTMLDDVAGIGTPIVVFSGGDPLQRDDLEDLVRHAKGIGLRAGAIPASTPRLTRERVESLKDAGLDQMALSLDGLTAEEHDTFRQVEGSYDLVMKGAQWARETDLPLQINTVFGGWNMHQFDEIADKVEALGTVFWEVFFLVPTGRGSQLKNADAAAYETLFEKLYQRSKTASYVIKVTEGQHYRRYVAQQKKREAAEGRGPTPGGHPGGGHPGGGHPGGGHPVGIKPSRGLTITRQGVNAGKGFCFVDHIGDVYPSGFLPVVAGNVRETQVSTLYRTSPLFTALRDNSLLKGRCGRCEYQDICGGSRARAHALTGDMHSADPCCGYVPGSG